MNQHDRLLIIFEIFFYMLPRVDWHEFCLSVDRIKIKNKRGGYAIFFSNIFCYFKLQLAPS